MEDTLLDILAYLVVIAGFILLLILFRVIACTFANLILLVLWWSLYLLTSGFIDWRDDLVGGSFFGPWRDVFTNGWKGLLKGLLKLPTSKISQKPKTQQKSTDKKGAKPQTLVQ